jgi:hypothetical protein
MAKKLTEHHPFMKKVVELYDIMEKMNIRIDNNRQGGLAIVDTENHEYYQLIDNESGEFLPDFPYFAEYKLVIVD